MRTALFLLFVISSFGIFSQCPILPTPVSYKTSQDFHLTQKLKVYDKYLSVELKKYITESFKKINISTSSIKTLRAPSLRFFKTTHEQKDYYELYVNEYTITINFTSEASAFYAIQSLFQLINEDHSEVEGWNVKDYPKFQWRGIHLDVSRHFFTVDEVKHFIDLMAIYKFNTFHWHLTDDQGWRIEIKKFPKLTEVGAWRDSTVDKHYTSVPRTYTVEKYGGFYTQEQIKDVLKYASERQITIVPEIEMPGHARAALAAYPEYSCTGAKQGVPGLWGVFDDIYCAKKESIDFNIAILEEVLTLFPSKYIHIGGDEAPKVRWHACPKCQKVIQENHLKDEHELQSYFIKQIDSYLTSKGRTLIGWDEILEGGLSPNAAVMSWRGTEGGIAAAKQGHQVVMSPGSHCYFDHYQSKSPNEPMAFGGFTPLEKVYEFNPIPKELSPEEGKLILGGQANLWTEYIPTMSQVEYMAFPRAIALSQALWCENKPDFSEFIYTLSTFHFSLMDAKKVHFSKAYYYPTYEINEYKQFRTFWHEFKSKNPNYSCYHSHYVNGVLEKISDKLGDEYDSIISPGMTIAIPKYSAKQVLTRGISVFDKDKFICYQKFDFHSHGAIGAKITFTTLPNKKYTTNLDYQLVDGIVGRRLWNSSEWLGFDTSQIELMMDLEAVKHIKTVELSFLDDIGSWIHLPKSVSIFYSEDQTTWKELKVEHISSKETLPLMQKARYLHFVIHTLEKIPEGNAGAGHVPWTFMDEIQLELE